MRISSLTCWCRVSAWRRGCVEVLPESPQAPRWLDDISEHFRHSTALLHGVYIFGQVRAHTASTGRENLVLLLLQKKDVSQAFVETRVSTFMRWKYQKQDFEGTPERLADAKPENTSSMHSAVKSCREGRKSIQQRNLPQWFSIVCDSRRTRFTGSHPLSPFAALPCSYKSLPLLSRKTRSAIPTQQSGIPMVYRTTEWTPITQSWFPNISREISFPVCSHGHAR